MEGLPYLVEENRQEKKRNKGRQRDREKEWGEGVVNTNVKGNPAAAFEVFFVWKLDRLYRPASPRFLEWSADPVRMFLYACNPLGCTSEGSWCGDARHLKFYSPDLREQRCIVWYHTMDNKTPTDSDSFQKDIACKFPWYLMFDICLNHC